jgi:DNA polymerase III delta prime subunit
MQDTKAGGGVEGIEIDRCGNEVCLLVNDFPLDKLFQIASFKRFLIHKHHKSCLPMSRIKHIEQALLRIGAGEFEALCNTLLFNHYRHFITASGSTIGVNKTRTGTPDAYITLPNGKFIIIEYTTQQKGICEKFADDIRKVLNEKETGLPVSAIEKIVICFNGNMRPDEVSRLEQMCRNAGCGFECFDTHALSHLTSATPGVAKDYLDIPVDTGQIFTVQGFIEQSTRFHATTPLENTFAFRNREIEQILELLHDNDIILIHGAPGVGKTKLALHIGQIFQQQHPDFELACIKCNNAPIYEDVGIYFGNSQSFVVIIDDANSFGNSLQTILSMSGRNSERTVKFILTVRSYLWETVRKEINAWATKDFHLLPLKDEEIREILKADSFKIHDEGYLIRICTLAQGNPRLAIMAAMVMLGRGWKNIQSNFDLYKEYFSPLMDTIEEHVGNNSIRILGNLAFWNVIKKSSNENEMVESLSKKLSLSPSEFWETLENLDRIELVDMYEGEMARINDQVFAAYIFFISFLDRYPQDFLYVLQTPALFAQLQRSGILNAVISAFGEAAREKLVVPCKIRWNEIKRDDEQALGFLQIFWFIEPPESYVFIKKMIDGLPIQDKIPTYQVSPAEVTDRHIILLAHLLGSGRTSTKEIEIGLLFAYAEKKPDVLPQVLKCIIEEVIFHPAYWHHRNYYSLRVLVETITKKIRTSTHPNLYRQTILALAPSLLTTRHRSAGLHDPFDLRKLTWSEFTLPLTDELRLLRSNVWECVFQQWNSGYKEEVFGVLHEHTRWIDPKANYEAYEKEMPVVMQFIEQELDSNNFKHCLLVHQYFSALQRNSIRTTEYRHTRNKFRGTIFQCYQTFLSDDTRVYMRHQQEEAYLNRKIEQYLEQIHTINDYQNVLDNCENIIAQLSGHSEQGSVRWKIDDLLRRGLTHFAKNEPTTTLETLRYVCSKGNPLSIVPDECIYELSQRDSEVEEHLFTLIQTTSFNRRDDWRWVFFKHIRSENIAQKHLDALLTFCDEHEESYACYDFKWISKFEKLQSDIVENVLERLLERSKVTGKVFGFESLCAKAFSKNIDAMLQSRPALMKELYHYAHSHTNLFDYNRDLLKRIVEFDLTFLAEYAEQSSEIFKHNTSHDQTDYSGMWSLAHYEQIFEHLWERFHGLIDLKSLESQWSCEYIGTFFRSYDNDSLHREKMLRFLYEKLDLYPNDEKHLFLVFRII